MPSDTVLSQDEISALLDDIPGFSEDKKKNQENSLVGLGKSIIDFAKYMPKSKKLVKHVYDPHTRPDKDITYICESCKREMLKTKLIRGYRVKPMWTVTCLNCNDTSVI